MFFYALNPNVCLSYTRRRQSWRTRQAASPLSGCARRRRDKHTPFLNYGNINRQRAKICADPLANSSPFSLSSYILLIPYPHYRRFPLLYSVYFQVIFKRLKISICNRDVCLSLIRECARARMREEKRFNSCIQVIFETLLMRRFRSHWHPDVCLSLIRERVRARKEVNLH